MLHLIFKNTADSFSFCNWLISTLHLPDAAAYALLMLCVLGCIAAGYFLGSVNSALVVSRSVFHDDIRKYGSGNAGMTNMFRTYGKKGGFLTLAGDFLKTVLATLIGFLLLPGDIGAYISGLFCVLGHSFPIYYRFKGGKGVLAAAVMLLMVDLPTFGLTVLVFAVILVGLRMVSLASIMAALFMPLWLNISYTVILGNGSTAGLRLFIAVIITFLVIFMHRENIRRIQKHEEPKIRLPWDKKKPDGTEKGSKN